MVLRCRWDHLLPRAILAEMALTAFVVPVARLVQQEPPQRMAWKATMVARAEMALMAVRAMLASLAAMVSLWLEDRVDRLALRAKLAVVAPTAVALMASLAELVAAVAWGASLLLLPFLALSLCLSFSLCA